MAAAPPATAPRRRAQAASSVVMVTAISNYNSGDIFRIAVNLVDSLGNSMSRGSFEALTTQAQIDVSSNATLTNYLTGPTSNVSSNGHVSFNYLRFRAPPGL